LLRAIKPTLLMPLTNPDSAEQISSVRDVLSNNWIKVIETSVQSGLTVSVVV
jgi:hypothetical protein